MTEIDAVAYIRLKACQPILSNKEYRTLREQLFNGDSAGVLADLRRILRDGSESH
jgi:hypothetical protein